MKERCFEKKGRLSPLGSVGLLGAPKVDALKENKEEYLPETVKWCGKEGVRWHYVRIC